MRVEDAQLRVSWVAVLSTKLRNVVFAISLISFESKSSSQKKNIHAVPVERCLKKVDRCKKTTEMACKQLQKKYSSIFGKSDSICGTDSKSYSDECELQKATCL